MRKEGSNLFTRSLFMAGFLASCTPTFEPLTSRISPANPPVTLPAKPEQQPFQAGFTPEQIRQRQAEMQQFSRKASYVGPISVKVDTGRIQPAASSGRVVDLSGYVALQAAPFSVQAIPAGPIVFQERFSKEAGPLEVTRSFRAANLSSRYTVHVQKLAAPGDNGHVEVNVNGTNWVLEQDFKHGELEVQRDSLLLNSNNSLRVRVKGRSGLSVIVTIVERGQAGTILRRQGKLGMPGETHQTHLRQNDVNIFDPTDPDSLGGLQPYEGVEKLDTGKKVYEFSELALNGVPVRIENGRLLMVFKDEARKQAFLSAYPAEIESEAYGACLVKFDLSRAPLQNLDELIRYANTRMMEDIKDVSVSSYDGLRTFAILLDVLKNFGDDYIFAEPNFKMHSNQAAIPGPVQPADWDDGTQSWWLKDTNVLNAWNYSIGTGVRVAWLDVGSNVTNLEHSELIRRTDFNFSRNDNLSLLDLDAFIGFSDNHSLYAQILGFGERDNNVGTTGVAPNSTLISYSVFTYWEQAAAILKAAYKANANLICANRHCLNCRLDGFRFFESAIGGGNALDFAVKWVTSGLQIPYIQAAGNSGGEEGEKIDAPGINVNTAIPNGDTPNIIVVGAVTPPASAKSMANLYNRNASSNFYEVTDYSGFGTNVIYGPGEGIQISDKDPSKPLYYMNGTSAATPFISGVVALMLSRNPGLKPPQILQILKNSSKNRTGTTKYDIDGSPNNPNFLYPSYAGAGTLKLIDVEEAVKQAIALSNKPLKAASEYFGIIRDNGSKQLLLNKNSDPTAASADKAKLISWQTVSGNKWNNLNDGAVVKVKAWSDVPISQSYVFPTSYIPKPLQDPLPIFPITVPISIPSDSLELLEVQKVCDLRVNQTYQQACTSSSGLSPTITKLEIAQNGATNVQTFSRNDTITFSMQGANLWLNNIVGGAKASLTLHQVNSTGNPVSPQNSYVFNVFPEIAANDGSSLNIRIAGAELIEKNIKTGDYRVSLSLLTGNTPLTGFKAGSTTVNFSISDDDGGFHILSESPPADAPPQIESWIVKDTRRLPVSSGSYLGIGIDAERLGAIEVLVDGKPMKFLEIAERYLAGTLPELEPGVKDVVIKLASGTITLEQALEYSSVSMCDPNEAWSMRIYNVDDTAKAIVNLNDFTYGTLSDSGYIPINKFLNRGQNQVRFSLFNTLGGYTWGFTLKKNNQVVYQSEEGVVGVVGANNNDQSRPNQTVFDHTVTITSNACSSSSQAGLLGTAFNNTGLTPPVYATKVFSQLNFVEGNKYGDQFGIGLTDNFSLSAEGKLSLPPGYPAGTYSLILAHDDGARLIFNNQTLIDAWGPYDYTEHATQVQLNQNQAYPIRVEFHENGGEAELGLFWIKPDGNRELVPESAFSH